VKKLKAPELKKPDLKVPDFLKDLYWDLRERHLLPLVALGVVAIVAVPFLLGGDSEEPAPVPPSSAGAPVPAGASSLAVVESKPGLRDYRKRLKARSATDPFEQRYTSAQLKGTQLGGGDEGESTSSTTTATSTTKTTKTTKTVEGKDGTTTVTTDTVEETSEKGSDGELTLFSFGASIKIVRIETEADGRTEKSDPVVRHRVVPPAVLPSEKTQVVTYMGISPETRKPLLLISDEVTSVFGEGNCLSGTSTCQLLEVETGFPVTFVHANGVRYKINVLKIEPVVSGKY
jgi:hypothetical protein